MNLEMLLHDSGGRHSEADNLQHETPDTAFMIVFVCCGK